MENVSIEKRLMELESQLQNKALVASDVVASLNPEQRQELADLTIEASSLRDHATFVPLYDRLDYDTLELTGRYLEQDTGSVSAGRRPATNKVQFDPKDVKAVLPLHHSYLRRLAPTRDPIEQKADMIAASMAKVISNDMEKMVWGSNLLGPSITEADYLNNGSGSTTNRLKDATFSLFDGVLAAADAAGSDILTVDANNSADIQAIMHNVIKKLPADYRREKDELRFFVPSNVEENLRSYLKLRDTAVGDLTLTEDNQIKFRGILVVSCPLFDVNPYVTEHVTLSGTTAVPLKYDNLPSAANVFVNASNLGSTPAAPFAITTDYVINATNGTIARVSGGGISDGATVKVTYQVLPSIYLTKRSNFVIAISVNDMDLSSQWFADEGVWKIVGRTRVDFKFVKEGWVARAINIQDAVVAS